MLQKIKYLAFLIHLNFCCVCVCVRMGCVCVMIDQLAAPGRRWARAKPRAASINRKVAIQTGKVRAHTHTQREIKSGRILSGDCILRCGHPVDTAGLFSFMTFHWLTPLVVQARRRGQLLLDDIWPVSPQEGCHANGLRWAQSASGLPSQVLMAAV